MSITSEELAARLRLSIEAIETHVASALRHLNVARVSMTSRLRIARRAAVVIGIAGSIALSCRALEHIGIGPLTDALSHASPMWLVAGLALICLSIVVRSVAWRAILRAALPFSRVRRRDALRGMAVGVLLSATLPARLLLQAVELVTTFLLGVPALITTGLSWNDVRLRAADAAPRPGAARRISPSPWTSSNGG